MATTYRHVSMKVLARYQIIHVLLGERRHIGVNKLPKVVARQCSGRELNLQPLDHESDTLTTTPPSHLMEWHLACKKTTATTIPRNFLLGSCQTWSNPRKMGQLTECVYLSVLSSNVVRADRCKQLVDSHGKGGTCNVSFADF